jgi:2,4-dienoyl-CoA reductase-like NADH-dependent reductase (Old Yellow Enzyme family)
MAEKAGLDYIQISGITWMKEKIKGLIYEDQATKLAEKIKIPVIVTAGARNVDELNEILNKSKIQYFGIVRPLICESDLKQKSQNVFHVIHAYLKL